MVVIDLEDNTGFCVSNDVTFPATFESGTLGGAGLPAGVNDW